MGLVVAGILLPRCMQNPPVAGGASDTEVSAQVCGTATDMYGNSIADALVQLRPKVIVSEEDSTGEEVGSLLLAEDTTDSLGFYRLDSVEEGAYHLTVTVGESLGTVQECNVFDREKVTLDPVLKPFGMVLGWLELPYEGAEVFARAKVRLLGTDMIVRPDSTGMFKISLPEGIHRLRLSVDSSFFDKVTIDVEVQPSQVKNIGIIRLTLLPPPPPRATASCAIPCRSGIFWTKRAMPIFPSKMSPRLNPGESVNLTSGVSVFRCLLHHWENSMPSRKSTSGKPEQLIPAGLSSVSGTCRNSISTVM